MNGVKKICHLWDELDGNWISPSLGKLEEGKGEKEVKKKVDGSPPVDNQIDIWHKMSHFLCIEAAKQVIESDANIFSSLDFQLCVCLRICSIHITYYYINRLSAQNPELFHCGNRFPICIWHTSTSSPMYKYTQSEKRQRFKNKL